MAVKAIPDRHPRVTAYLVVHDAAAAIDFYKRVFGAREEFRMEMPGGKVGHAEVRIGDSIVMLADEAPQMGCMGPRSLGGSPVGLLVYFEDCDHVYEQALAAGATAKQPPRDQFYGDRSGTFTDPFGHLWTVATHKEDLTREEIDRRMADMMAQHKGACDSAAASA